MILNYTDTHDVPLYHNAVLYDKTHKKFLLTQQIRSEWFIGKEKVENFLDNFKKIRLSYIGNYNSFSDNFKTKIEKEVI
jgi:hypothetical protein